MIPYWLTLLQNCSQPQSIWERLRKEITAAAPFSFLDRMQSLTLALIEKYRPHHRLSPIAFRQQHAGPINPYAQLYIEACHSRCSVIHPVG
jgi:hypothetical protein